MPWVHRVRERWVKSAVFLAIVPVPLLLAAAGWQVFGSLSAEQSTYVHYRVQRGSLPIVVMERGTLESQLETQIRCEVENSSFDRSSGGTQILFIVPNGSAVKEGELLVELDSAAIRERLDNQQLAYDRAASQRVQAEARYQNRLTQNETAEAQAELEVELAELDLKMYLDDNSGTFKLAMEDIERQIEESKNKILEAQAALELAKTDTAGVEALFKLGYRGRSDLDQSRFRFMQAEDLLASSVNKLDNYQATRKKLETYERQKQVLTLSGSVETAKRSLKQVKLDNESLAQQALAAKVEAEKAESKERERLQKYGEQLAKCKIFAPHEGMVVYSRDHERYGGSPIAEGIGVRERQHLLSLPDLSQMQVKTQVHEAVLDQVRRGLQATVKIDAFPDRIYTGTVHSVAVVPSSNRFSSVSTYECIVRIQERVEQLKPGMTAVVEIDVERLDNILSVPVQAVVQIKGVSWCYVETDQGIERRELELGRTNDKFVHVRRGLNENDLVILTPMSIVEESEEQGNEGSEQLAADESQGDEASRATRTATADQRGAAQDGAGEAGVERSTKSTDPRRSREDSTRQRGNRPSPDALQDS